MASETKQELEIGPIPQTAIEMSENRDSSTVEKPTEGTDSSSVEKPEDLVLQMRGISEITGPFIVRLNLSKFRRNLSFKSLFNTIQFMALVGFCLSFFDVAIGDGLVSYDFLNGADYIKTVNDTLHPDVTNYSCKQIATHHHYTEDNATVYTFTCNERDPIWGSLSLAIIAGTGLVFATLNGPKLGRNIDSQSWIVWITQKLVFFVFYPLIMLSLKFAAIFTDDEEWKSASMILTGVEGNCEAYFQLVLQLFIIFSRADRQPTIVQFISLASSLLSMSKAKIESMFAKTPNMSMQDQASYGFYALCMSVYSCGGYALTITTIRWNLILMATGVFAFVITLFCCMGCCLCCILSCSCCEDAFDGLEMCGHCCLSCLGRCCGIAPKKMTKKGKAEPSEEKSEENFELSEENFELSKIQPIAAYIVYIIQAFFNGIVLTVIAILANFYPDTTIWNLWDDSFKLSELAIVDRGYFNIVFGAVILCGILQLILHRFHFMKPENEEENSEKKPESEEKYEEKSKETTKEQSKEKSEEKFEKKDKE